MTLQLRTKARLFDLHCSIGLTDWDMDKELKLATTTDQFYHDDKLSDQYVVQRPSARASRRKDEFIWYDKTSDTFVKPNLWLLVNPSIACPIQYGENGADLPTEPAEETHTAPLDPAATRHQLNSELRLFSCHDASLQEELLHSVSSSAEYMIQNDDVSCRPAKNRRKGRTTKARDSKILKPGCWPRPPVNYCILIALALKSSHSGSLKVQQIYHFTRKWRLGGDGGGVTGEVAAKALTAVQDCISSFVSVTPLDIFQETSGQCVSGENFPFFQTAPDGWKNTIRHNLCFNNSFRKTCNQLCRDGKRKSCFWHLTLDGQRRLKDEICTLTGETFKQLERSMAHPDVIRTLLAL
ncbi:forkhead box protein R1 isoform X1 [Acanthopagrus latus]|uniref:forkhead box protein R1 isoform X1 n=1 Tax=Acanthopagrus latus TaxID=8177 RepID=UPI00187CD8B3|nr:forkhead box protein R1 isoform X1 [Acanthopagrus latus]